MLIYKTEYFGHPVELTFIVQSGEIKITHVRGDKNLVEKIHQRQYDEWAEEIDNALCEELVNAEIEDEEVEVEVEDIT